MPFEFFVALRYLSASRKRAHVALISVISVGGLALGVAALVVSIALLTGFQDRIRQRLAETTPHLTALPIKGGLFEEPAALARTLEADPRVVSVKQVLEGRGWITDLGGRSALPVRFRAAEGNPLEPGKITVSPAIAGQLGLTRGSLVRLFSTRTVLSPLGPLPISLAFRVAEIRGSGISEGVPDVEFPIADARALAGTPSGASKVELKLRSSADAEGAARSFSRTLGAAAVFKPWNDLNVGLSFALRLEKILIFATVFLIVVVASLNVVADLSLLVVEKRSDLGVLATLGASGSSLSRIYWWLGAMIGAAGTVLGAAGGAAISLFLDRYSLIPLPEGVYLLSHVPFALHAGDLALVVAVSSAACLAAAAWPARLAARVGPGEAVHLSQ
jgi:lipoprotein-releasing system permease protein